MKLGSYLLLLGLLLLGYEPVACAQQNELESIQSQIRQTQKTLNKNLKTAERLQQQVKLAELEIAKTATILNKTDRSLLSTKAEMRKLEEDKNKVEKELEQQKALLASQLKSAFMAGNYDFAKMLFNQDDAGRFERVLTYYKYLNNARQKQIEAFRDLVIEFQQIETSLVKKTAELGQLLAQQKQQSTQLREQQKSRQLTFRKLDQQIKTDKAKVGELQQEEKSLQLAIERAEKEARDRQTNSDVVLNGLANMKGKLPKPAVGKINALFGKRRQGQVSWKGIVINAAEGSSVVAVHSGKVLYADWLKGFGLVIIVDHGQGYMSVYGRNQALLKQAGDTVQANETIGLVGQSGGQQRASLYFEIRHKGKALNPSHWINQ